MHRRKGRIWIGWQSDFVDCQILSVECQFIHCCVTDLAKSAKICITFVYGLHTVGDRKLLWPQLHTLSDSVSGPWLCAGDFNTIYAQNHREGGNPLSLYGTCDFATAIDDMQVFHVNSWVVSLLGAILRVS